MSFVYDWKVKNGDDVKVEYCWSSVDNCIKIVEMRVNGKFHRETWMSQNGRDELHQLLTEDYMNRNGIYITKFEKNYNRPSATRITYQLINAFPKAIQAIPVQYGGAEVMKVSVTMYYDRYRIWRDFNQYGPVLGDPTLGQNDLVPGPGQPPTTIFNPDPGSFA